LQNLQKWFEDFLQHFCKNLQNCKNVFARKSSILLEKSSVLLETCKIAKMFLQVLQKLQIAIYI
jgi:hypothetical protein